MPKCKTSFLDSEHLDSITDKKLFDAPYQSLALALIVLSSDLNVCIIYFM